MVLKKIMALFFLASLSLPFAFCGGPLSVSRGEPIVWRQFPIHYKLDNGRLGPLSQQEAATLATQSFALWQNVDTSTIYFFRDNDYPVDITSRNYSSLVANSPVDGIISIIYDDDGGIIDSLMGSGSKANILGLANSRTNTSTRSIVDGFIILNGYYFSQQSSNSYTYTAEDIFSSMVHEIGHIIGLDHAQHSRHLANDGVGINDRYVPIMFPTSTDDEKMRTALTFDDTVAISNLYPTNTFRQMTGKISGTVRRLNQDLPGVNVIARSLDRPYERVASTVTGTYSTNGGFELAGLPAGHYELAVEAIDDFFTGASSVGQYAENSSDLSFKNPVQPEFYNSNNQTDEARSHRSTITVNNGQTTSNIIVNVAKNNLTADEEYIRLLGLDTLTLGGVGRQGGAYSSSNEFLLDLNGSEGMVTLEFTFEGKTSAYITVKRITRSGATRTRNYSFNSTVQIIQLGKYTELELLDARYFITVKNNSPSSRVFTIAVSQTGQTPTHTPTPVPEATPTYTPTPSPIYTPTPTAPVPTPTIPAIRSDINKNGLVDKDDIFSFASDWGKYVIVAPGKEIREFKSNLDSGKTLTIDIYDLLIFLERYPIERNE
jgi:hypothetical protein